MQQKESGLALKKRGCNCAQAVLMAMGDLTGLDSGTACRVACGFGGGMRAGGLCGAAAGAVMAIGMVMGNGVPEDTAARARSDAAVIEFNRRFKERFGALNCHELLGANSSTPEGKKWLGEHPERKELCARLIEEAGQIAREVIAERPGQ